MSSVFDAIKNNAVSLAEDAISCGCMYSINAMPDIGDHDWGEGDPENFSTIAEIALETGRDELDESEVNDYIDKIVEHLSDLYPDYI